MSRRLNLTITCETGREFVPFLWTNVRRAYAVWASKIRQSQNMGPTPMLRELSVALIGDRRMSALHQEFMGIAGTTDVLSFPLEADARGRVISGEVVVCVPQARRQAKIRKTAAKHELLLYAVHGMLHLPGHDDRTDRAYHAMHAAEDELMMKLGVGTVFARPPVLRGGPERARGERPARTRVTRNRAATLRRGAGAGASAGAGAGGAR